MQTESNQPTTFFEGGGGRVLQCLNFSIIAKTKHYVCISLFLHKNCYDFFLKALNRGRIQTLNFCSRGWHDGHYNVYNSIIELLILTTTLNASDD
jgi:hypothetical protein